MSFTTTPRASSAPTPPSSERISAAPVFEGDPVQVWRHKARVSRVTFSPDGTRLASAGDDLRAHVWRLGRDEPERTIDAHLSPVFAVEFSPCGKKLLTAGQYCNCEWAMWLWCLEEGGELAEFEPHTGLITRAAFSPDGRHLLTGNVWRDNAARVWDAKTGEEIFRLVEHERYPEHVAFSPDGSWMATGEAWGAEGPYRVIFWCPETGDSTRSIEFPHDVRGLAPSPDGKRLAVARGRVAPETFALSVFDVGSGEEIQAFEGPLQGIRDIAFAPDGERLASCGEDGHVRLWSVANGQEVMSWRVPRGVVESVSISPKGDFIAAAGDDGAVRVWELPPLEASK